MLMLTEVLSLLAIAAFYALVVFLIWRVVRLQQKSPLHYGLLFAVILFTWWLTGLIYTLGHTLFTGFLPQPVYNALGYVIAGPFILLSVYLLNTDTNLIYHVLLVAALGFGAGALFGFVQKRYRISR